MLLTIAEVAQRLRLHPITIRRYIREGKLQALKIGGRIRITKTAVDSLTKTLHPLPRHLQPHQLTRRKTRRIFTTSDPLWRLKGITAANI